MRLAAKMVFFVVENSRRRRRRRTEEEGLLCIVKVRSVGGKELACTFSSRVGERDNANSYLNGKI